MNLEQKAFERLRLGAETSERLYKANVSIIYPEDCYGEESGVRIDEIMYLKSSSADSKKNGVFIKIG